MNVWRKGNWILEEGDKEDVCKLCLLFSHFLSIFGKTP